MSMTLYDLSGQPTHWAPTDRGWQFGDGVFRTVRVVNGVVHDMVGQVAHLLHDAHLLGLEPLPAVDELCDATTRVARGLKQARMKWVITAGDSAGGYMRSGPATAVLAVSPLPETFEPPEQLHLWLCHTPVRPGGGWSGAKHLNRLENVMARCERDPHERPEGLMCDYQGHVASGIMTNVFWVESDGTLCTHPLNAGGVHGRTRSRILALDTPVRLVQRAWSDWKQEAISAFVCNSVWGCVDVASVDDWVPAGSGRSEELNKELGLGRFYR